MTQCNAAQKRNAQTFAAFIGSVLESINAQDRNLGLFVSLAEAEVLAAACALDAHPKRFKSLPLVGIPVVVKYIIDVAGVPTTFG